MSEHQRRESPRNHLAFADCKTSAWTDEERAEMAAQRERDNRDAYELDADGKPLRFPLGPAKLECVSPDEMVNRLVSAAKRLLDADHCCMDLGMSKEELEARADMEKAIASLEEPTQRQSTETKGE